MNKLLATYIVHAISIVLIAIVSCFFNEHMSGDATIERFLLININFVVVVILYEQIARKVGL